MHICLLMEQIHRINFMVFSLGNSIIIPLLIIASAGLVYIFHKLVFYPNEKKLLNEVREQELKKARLTALFAELDPEPVIRIDSEGNIISSNEASAALAPRELLHKKNIRDIVPFEIDIRESITKDKSVNLTGQINKKHFSILFQGVSYLNIAQIYFHDTTEIKEYEEKLIESQKRQKELANLLREKIEKEKQKIASRIYDEVSQNLSLVRLKLQKLDVLRSSDLKSDEYSKTISLLETAINELKEISNNLKPKILDEVGLAPALTSLCDTVSRESGMKGSINILQNDKRMDKEYETHLFRIIQEALSNIVVHSKASEFNIQLIDNEKYTRVFLSDNGIGFEPEKFTSNGRVLKGLGLLNIQERADLLNGKLKIDSSPENGTLIIVEIPKEAGLINV